jgi:hypothetical protein
VSRQPRAFFTIDFGTATTAAALVGHAGGRWRLLAHAAMPATAGTEALLLGLVDRVRQVDQALLEEVAVLDKPKPEAVVADLTRLEAHSSPPKRIAVIAGSKRQLRRLEEVAARAGWLITGGSADEQDAIDLSRLALSPETHAVVLGADPVPGGDEKRHLQMLGAVVSAAARSRPELAVVLAGGAAALEPLFLAAGPAVKLTDVPGAWDADRDKADDPGLPSTGPHSVLIAPDAESGMPAGSALQQVLEGLRSRSDDSRLAIARSTRSLAYVLDRSIETVEVGLNGGLRCRAEPFGPGHRSVVESHGIMALGSLSPVDPPDEVIDGVLSWSTVAFDRQRLADRLLDLRLWPWGEAEGEGALLRLAAAKAAVSRLVDSTPEISLREMPDVLIAGGGIWSSTPASVVALAMADLVRRPGVSLLTCDQARMLGPLGNIPDEDERRLMLRDLTSDVLMSLGTLILPSGIRQGRSAGRMRVSGGAVNSDIDLQPGGIWSVELAPGQTATAEMDFKDAVRLTTRGKRFSLEVAGGLGGLFVDLRDIPLRMPDRADLKRSTWEAWQRAMWPEIDE